MSKQNLRKWLAKWCELISCRELLSNEPLLRAIEEVENQLSEGDR